MPTPTVYNIYIVNHSANTQNFWLFLERPDELATDPKVFANSSASLSVEPEHQGLDSFGVPVQYVVGAGASNNAVGLNIQVTSNVSKNVNLKEQWDAIYYNAPPKQGPDLKKGSGTVPDNAIAIVTNPFNKVDNETAEWYSNQSFGIETAQGFIGMTWSPEPNQKRVLAPKLKFYVAVGKFGANTLAAWTDVSVSAQEISVPSDFDHLNCTVTYAQDGTWTVQPGKPTPPSLRASLLSDLVLSHLVLSRAHAGLVDLVRLAPNILSTVLALPPSVDGTQEDTLASVEWDPAVSIERDNLPTLTYLSGTITVGAALAAGFTYFLLSGIKFQVTRTGGGQTSVHFSYSGTRSADAIKGLFVQGAKLFFGRDA